MKKRIKKAFVYATPKRTALAFVIVILACLSLKAFGGGDGNNDANKNDAKFSFGINLGVGQDYLPEHGFLQKSIKYPFYQLDVVVHTNKVICFGVGASSPHEIYYEKQNRNIKMTPFYAIVGLEAPNLDFPHVAHLGAGIKFGACATGLKDSDPGAPGYFSGYINVEITFPFKKGEVSSIGAWIRPELSNYWFGQVGDEYEVDYNNVQASLAVGISLNFGKKK